MLNGLWIYDKAYSILSISALLTTSFYASIFLKKIYKNFKRS